MPFTVTVLLIALLANIDRKDMAIGTSGLCRAESTYGMLSSESIGTGISYLARYSGQVFGVGISGAVRRMRKHSLTWQLGGKELTG